MNSFLLTISGVLFLLTCGLSMPTPTCKTIRVNITGYLREDVACGNNVTLFVPALENTNFPATAKCFQDQLKTIESNCAVNNPSTVHHARGILKTIRNNVQNNAECIFETNETVSYSAFLDRFKGIIEKYNSFCSASKQK